MRLEQLKAFLAIAETGSFQKAAQACGTTQPTISRQLQALETQIGTPLFHRGSPVTLTRAGKHLLAYAHKICQSWTRAMEELADLLSGGQSELCIAVIGSVCSYYLPAVVLEFSRLFPEIQLRVTSLGSDRALKVLHDGLVDVAIVMNNPLMMTSQEIVMDTLYEEPIQVLMARGHPLSKQEQVSWQGLSKYDHVVYKDGYGMQRWVYEQFQSRRLPLRTILEANVLDTFRGVVRQGQAVALLPHAALLEAQYDPGLVIRPIGNVKLTRQVVLVTTKDRLEISPIQQFYQLARQLIPAQVQNKAPAALVSWGT